MTVEQEYATHIVDLLDRGSAFDYHNEKRQYRLSRYPVPAGFFADGDICRRRARVAFDAALRYPTRRKRSKS